MRVFFLLLDGQLLLRYLVKYVSIKPVFFSADSTCKHGEAICHVGTVILIFGITSPGSNLAATRNVGRLAGLPVLLPGPEPPALLPVRDSKRFQLPHIKALRNVSKTE